MVLPFGHLSRRALAASSVLAGDPWAYTSYATWCVIQGHEEGFSRAFVKRLLQDKNTLHILLDVAAFQARESRGPGLLPYLLGVPPNEPHAATAGPGPRLGRPPTARPQRGPGFSPHSGGWPLRC